MAPENVDKEAGGELDPQAGGWRRPPGSPSRPNLGLSFPWPCPLHPHLGREGAIGRGGGKLKSWVLTFREHTLTSVSRCLPGSSAPSGGLAFLSLLILGSLYFCLFLQSPSPQALPDNPSSVCPPLAQFPGPHLWVASSWSTLQVHFSALTSGLLALVGGGAPQSPLPASLLSRSWLALPVCLRLPVSPLLSPSFPLHSPPLPRL